MSYRESAGNYYGNGRGCAEALLLAARDDLGMEYSDADVSAFAGFGGGMGCKSTCGGLTAAVAILGKRFAGREDIRAISAGYVELFTRELGSISCEELENKYRTPELRCRMTVEKTAELLDNYIAKLEGREKKAPVGEGCTIDAANIKRVKGLGFLNNKGTNMFNGRIITRNGRITAAEAIKIGEAAEKFGDGHIALTTRLTAEVSGIHYDDIEAFRSFVGEVGLETGGTGSKVRPVVSCKGTTCQYGLYDTFALSEKAHQRFYIGYHTGVDLPHKFKIAFGGCPNNCVKPSLNDIGIIGARKPIIDLDKCKGCKKCKIETECPIKIAKVVDGKITINPDQCNKCGRCVSKCPFHAIEDSTYGWRIVIGGRWGKRIAEGKMLNHFFTSEEEVLDTIDKTILFFRSEGISGERLSDTVNRLGFDYVEQKLLSNELMEKKSEILGLNVVGGATC